MAKQDRAGMQWVQEYWTSAVGNMPGWATELGQHNPTFVEHFSRARQAAFDDVSLSSEAFYAVMVAVELMNGYPDGAKLQAERAVKSGALTPEAVTDVVVLVSFLTGIGAYTRRGGKQAVEGAAQAARVSKA